MTLSAARVAIPFVTTSPRWDLMAVIAGLPLWWALGVEQFAYPVLLLPPVLKVLVQQRRVIASPVLVSLVAFLAIYLASALFIVEAERYLSFAKNVATYATALMLLVVIPGVVRTWTDVRALVAALLFAMAVAGVVGALAIAGFVRGTFTSPFGALLPDALASTALGTNIADRSLGWTSWFAGLGTYFRISSVFLWPTSYAPAITLTLPLVAFFAATARRWVSRLGWSLLALLLVVNLVYTTGRMAAAALGVAALYWFAFRRERTSAWTRTIVVAATCAVAAAFVMVEPSAVDVVARIEQAVFARGSGSPTSRWTIYVRTLEGFAERPLLGWGTERTIAGTSDAFIYPAGSHSYVLGTLYRQGILGLAAFAVVWWTTWRATAAARAPTGWPAEARAFLGVAQAVVVAALIMSLTVAFDLDASLMFVWWVIVACVVAVGVRRAPSDRSTEERSA